ncbi:MAG: NUDIX hydrolase [Candidatus Poseidoniales archaeon]|jgi:8-oxo-dGTP pyrophosphatase MutT (NUDIX family)
MEPGTVINAVGVWFYSIKTNRYLYLLRNDGKNPHTWGLPGGKSEDKETLYETIHRECTEELGNWPEPIKLVPIEQFTSPDSKFTYHTFFCLIDDEFVPDLNEEHCGYSWIQSGVYPKPMHPGLWSTVQFDEIMNKITTIQNNY